MWQETANHLWQSTLFVICIAALCLLLRRDSARIRYWLWWIGSVKFLLPFSLLTYVGNWLSARAAVDLATTWPTTMSGVARPFGAEPGTWTTGALLLTLWAGGTLIVLVCWIARAARLNGLLRAAVQEPQMLRHGKRDIRIYRTRACIEPGVVGLLRPALLLPVGLEQRLTPSQLEAVLAHELCHIRRRDNLTAAVQMLVEAVFWFHPLIWWLGHRLIDERERACDEMVVALGHDRETYAAGILAVCEHYAATRLACASGISGSDLKRRIVEIMSYHGMRRLKLVKKLLLSAASIAALALPVLAGLVIEQVADAQQNAPDRTAFTEYLPVYKVPPVYPPEAVERRTEGYVVVEFTVTETGSTANVRVVESSDPIFNASAIESASQYRYTPRVTDGATVEVPGVRTRLLYVLDGLDDGPPPELIQLKTEPLEYLPIVKVAPVYPPRAAAQGIDGFVIVQYTVTTSGNTKDITVIESSNSLFEPAAVQSVRKYKYQPKLIEGRPVEVQGLTTKIEFALND